MENSDSLCQLVQIWGQAVKLCTCENQCFCSSERFTKGSHKGKLLHLVFRLGENNRNISNLVVGHFYFTVTDLMACT